MPEEPQADPDLKIPEEKRTGISYFMGGDGHIWRIDHDDRNARRHMAVHDGTDVIYDDEEARKFHVRIAQYLKQNGIEFSNVFVRSPGTAPKVEPPLQKNPIDFVDPSENIPPPPMRNKRDGDKTPAYVEWLQRYKPDEFNERYGIIGPGSVTKYKKVPHKEIAGRYHREPYQKKALLGRRKTHLTEKPDAQGEQTYAPIPPREDMDGGDEE